MNTAIFFLSASAALSSLCLCKSDPGLAKMSAHAAVQRIEAPVTWKGYLMCAFASFGGILFGYDIGYINSVLGMDYFIHTFTGMPFPPATPRRDFVLSTSDTSLITSIMSAGTFVGALIAGDVSDFIGRKWAVVVGCIIFIIGVAMQVASASIGLLVGGRLIAGIGVGFESSIVILYMSEIAPRKVRGALVSGYQLCITIGILLAACVNYATQNRLDSGSYRIPIGIQILWALILGGGLACLPESPKYLVKRGRMESATKSLAKIRGQPADSHFVKDELAEVVANYEYELSVVPQTSYFASWANCFKGSLWDGSSNLRRTILGTSLQMMQQWTGVKFIFYFGTRFFIQLGTISNPFLISLITTSMRPLLIYGALGMLSCQFITAIIGTVVSTDNASATSAQIAFICIAIAFFAATWGPVAWVVIGETFPLPIRSRGVGLSTSSNWLWNCILAVISPYFVGEEYGNLGPKVFFIWGGLCTIACVYAYFLVPETKGLTLEQVDLMLEQTTPRTSAGWRPSSTFADKLATGEKASHVDVEAV
ncbi:Major facilitator-type transporter ecdD [Pseudocercospora fuligena]|uniref:Major facilitator-type transporter ecdD n=1 Tax=Pseudocercospora fuligena TaxID=685502 RepID=A0A8H6RJR2_9PEZI|nr:Major facilitator-type transporter ecdD [Pseudocercospora fuligena]